MLTPFTEVVEEAQFRGLPPGLSRATTSRPRQRYSERRPNSIEL